MKKNLWRRPIFLPYLQPDLTDEIVADAQQKLGRKLPDAYIEILREQNGGYIRYNLPDYDLSLHGCICGIGPHYPNILDERAPLLDSADFVSFDIEGLLPFDGDGHWYICMDYRNNATEPEITYVDLELDKQKKVAATFEEYLSMLGYYEYEESIGEDYGYVIEGDYSIPEIAKALGESLDVEFEYMGDDHQYGTYRAQVGGSWAFLSPNKVRYAYIPDDNERYHELKPLMGGTALRYPEIPENAVFFSAIDEYIEKLLADVLIEAFPVVKHERDYLDIVLVPENSDED